MATFARFFSEEFMNVRSEQIKKALVSNRLSNGTNKLREQLCGLLGYSIQSNCLAQMLHLVEERREDGMSLSCQKVLGRSRNQKPARLVLLFFQIKAMR